MKIETEIKFYSDAMFYKQDNEKMTNRNVETNLRSQRLLELFFGSSLGWSGDGFRVRWNLKL